VRRFREPVPVTATATGAASAGVRRKVDRRFATVIGIARLSVCFAVANRTLLDSGCAGDLGLTEDLVGAIVAGTIPFLPDVGLVENALRWRPSFSDAAERSQGFVSGCNLPRSLRRQQTGRLLSSRNLKLRTSCRIVPG
jgi:hypothetical protein